MNGEYVAKIEARSVLGSYGKLNSVQAGGAAQKIGFDSHEKLRF